MDDFKDEFHKLNAKIIAASKILLVAHTRPDGDTVGSVVALGHYIKSIDKTADIACFDEFPSYLSDLFSVKFTQPQNLNLSEYDLVIACDSVERGFEKIYPTFQPHQSIVLIDHHPDININGDIRLIDENKSSTCEIIYHFFISNQIKITPYLATAILTGILSDTGNLQHSNTSTQVMNISSILIKKGAAVSRIVEAVFADKKISTLKLWGIALKKAKIISNNSMIATVLTQKDVSECEANADDISQIASILNTVPGTKFSLVLAQRDAETIKGSLRSEEYKGVDVSLIARKLGGGGHKLASGFEMKGKIKETKTGWEII